MQAILLLVKLDQRGSTMIHMLEHRKLAVKTPYSGTVLIVPFRSARQRRIQVSFRFRGFVKRENQKAAVKYLKAEGFVERAIRE
jgi:hypothetical protein